MNERYDEIDDAVAVEGRLYLLTANAVCWKGGRSQRAGTFVVPDGVDVQGSGSRRQDDDQVLRSTPGR
jgi:hypothetical protein